MNVLRLSVLSLICFSIPLFALGQTDSGLIFLPNKPDVIHQLRIKKMKVYKSYSEDSFTQEYLSMVYYFDTLGRIISVEDYYRNELRVQIKRTYYDSSSSLKSDSFISVGGESRHDNYSKGEMVGYNQISLCYSLGYSVIKNPKGLFVELVDYTMYKYLKTRDNPEIILKPKPVAKYRIEYF